jgi:quercetin dioxygenase-like cupin family protein
MEIRRFGPGHRRLDGPPGTQGLAGQLIWNDENASISELAFTRRGFIAPHTNPNTALFIVVSGGGMVRVGDEQVPINHGEAVVWPPDVIHGAYTDGVEMRAIVVELKGTGIDDALVIEGRVPPLGDFGPTERSTTPATAPPWDTAPPSANERPETDAASGDTGSAHGPSADASRALSAVEPARGALSERPVTRSDYDASEGEPW